MAWSCQQLCQQLALKKCQIKNEMQRSGLRTKTLWGGPRARRRVMPRGAGGGETLARVPDREKLGH